MTIFFSDELPNALIFSSEQKVKVYNGNKIKWDFYAYNSDEKKFDEILYKPYAKLFSDIKENADLIEVDVLENYATDKRGKLFNR